MHAIAARIVGKLSILGIASVYATAMDEKFCSLNQLASVDLPAPTPQNREEEVSACPPIS
jgi:hypothetical protein